MNKYFIFTVFFLYTFVTTSQEALGKEKFTIDYLNFEQAWINKNLADLL